MAIELRAIEDADGKFRLVGRKATGTQTIKFDFTPRTLANEAWLAGFLAGHELVFDPDNHDPF